MAEAGIESPVLGAPPGENLCLGLPIGYGT